MIAAHHQKLLDTYQNFASVVDCFKIGKIKQQITRYSKKSSYNNAYKKLLEASYSELCRILDKYILNLNNK